MESNYKNVVRGGGFLFEYICIFSLKIPARAAHAKELERAQA